MSMAPLPPSGATITLNDDIYGLTHASIAHSKVQSFVFVAVHSSGAVSVVHPDSGVSLVRYEDLDAACVHGSGELVSDPSTIWVGRAKKRGASCYRVVNRTTRSSTTNRRHDVSSDAESSEMDVELVELCTVPCAGEAVTAVAAAFCKHPSSFLLAAFDTSSVLRLWHQTKARGEDRVSDASPSMKSSLLCEIVEPVPFYALITVPQMQQLWCCGEGGVVVVYSMQRAMTPRPQGDRNTSNDDDEIVRRRLRHGADGSSSTAAFRDLISDGEDVEATTTGDSDRGSEVRDRHRKRTHTATMPTTTVPSAKMLDEVLRRAISGNSAALISMSSLRTSSSTALVITGSEKGDVCIWDATTLTLAQYVAGCHATAVSAMCSVPSLNQLWTLSTDRTLVIWRRHQPVTGGESALSHTSTMRQALRISLEGDSSSGDGGGRVYCLCYAAPLGVVAGGGGQSDLLCWYPNEISLPSSTAANPSDTVEAAEASKPASVPPVPTRSPTTTTVEIVNVSGGVNASPDPVERSTGRAGNEDLSPQLRTGAPQDRSISSSNDKNREAIEQLEQQLVAPREQTPPPPPPSLPETTRLDAEQPRREMVMLLNAATSGVSQQVVLSTADHRNHAERSEADALRAEMEQLRRDHQAELVMVRKAFAEQLQEELTTTRRREARMREDAEVHSAARLAAEVLQAKHEVEQLWQKRCAAIERNAHAEMAASEAQWSKQREEFVMNIHSLNDELLRARLMHEDALAQVQGRYRENITTSGVAVVERPIQTDASDAVAPAAGENLSQDSHRSHFLSSSSSPRSTSQGLAAATSSGGGAASTQLLNLVDALTSEVKRLKRKSIRAQTHSVGIQTNNTNNVASSPPREGMAAPHLAKDMSVVAPQWGQATENTSTNLLTAGYLAIRESLGSELASLLLQNALSDPALEEREVLELLIRELCLLCSKSAVVVTSPVEVVAGLGAPSSSASSSQNQHAARGVASWNPSLSWQQQQLQQHPVTTATSNNPFIEVGSVSSATSTAASSPSRSATTAAQHSTVQAHPMLHPAPPFFSVPHPLLAQYRSSPSAAVPEAESRPYTWMRRQ